MRYKPELDGLRFFAILFVLIAHFFPWLGRFNFNIGYSGVELFLVISGFLITSILLNSADPIIPSYRRFLGRRTLRIFPIYYLTLLVLYVFKTEAAQQNIGYLLTYTYNYARVFKGASDEKIGHFWSLCVEEQFYLFWPFLILGLRNKPVILKTVIVGLILLCGVQVLADVIPAPDAMNTYFTFPRAYGLLIGSFGAVLLSENRLPFRYFRSRALEVAVVFSLMYLAVIDGEFKRLLYPLLCLYLVAKPFCGGYSLAPVTNVLTHRWVAYVGSISYGIYLYHLPLGDYLSETAIPDLWKQIPFNEIGLLGKIQYNFWIVEYAKAPVYFLLTIVLAHLSYQFIESPILHLKEKWFPRKKASTQQYEKPLIVERL